MNGSLLCLLYPLIRFRHSLQWKRFQTLLDVKQRTNKLVETDSNVTLQLAVEASQIGVCWSSALNIVYIAISAFGVVGYCSWYIMHHDASPTISFALTMEMVTILFN